MIAIVKVRSCREFGCFISFPDRLYKDDPNYVPELRIVRKMMLDRKKNPFFKHSKAEFFMAVQDRAVVGRIAVIRNNIHIRQTGERCGFFGFFDVVEDYEIAKRLIDQAVMWLENEKLDCLIGPENFTTNDSCGILVSGYDTPPVVMMPYNKPYYEEFLNRYGFQKEIDLYSYCLNHLSFKHNYLKTLCHRIKSNLMDSGINVRSIQFGNQEEEINRLREVYNLANQDNWGFIPLDENEFREKALQLKQLVTEELILVAEKDNRFVGFVVAVPDINQILIRIKAGKLGLFGLLQMFWHKRKVNNSRILILGVLEEYRNKGIDIYLYEKIQENLKANGIFRCEACYVLENNETMNAILEKLGGERIKTYRIYRYKMK